MIEGSPTPRRLLFVITSLTLGGADRQVRDLAGAFDDRGWEVRVVSLTEPNPWPEDLMARHVRVETLAMRPTIPHPSSLVAFARLVRRWRPDVVHGHMFHANLLTRLARPLAPVPLLVSTVHSANEGGAWRYVASRVTYALSDVTTAVSKAALDESIRRRSVPRGGILLVPNGIDLAAFPSNRPERARMRELLGLSPDAFVWLNASRLVALKGHAILLAAFQEVRRSHPHAVLLIAGSGPLDADIRATAAQMGLLDAVRFLGTRADVPALLQAADAFVLSSLWEGLPVALLEAAATGLPVVATDVGGNQEIVLNRVTGLLVRPEAAALAGSMSELMELGHDGRAAMGVAAVEHVTSQFSLRQIVDRWEELYEDGLARSPSRRRWPVAGSRTAPARP